MYQDQYDREKIIKKDASMNFLDTSRHIYPETDPSGVGLGSGFPQVRDGMNCWHDEVSDNATLHPTTFASKSLLSAEWCYNNRE